MLRMIHQNQPKRIIAYDKQTKRMSAVILCVIMVLTGLTSDNHVYAEPVAVSPESVSNDTGASYRDIDFGFTEEELALPENISENIAMANNVESMPYALAIERQAGQEEQLPEAYCGDEVKDALPALRNQLPYGCCWSFSALGACEASLIRKGISSNSIDLSERHLAYYFYNKGAETSDSFGLTKGDYNQNISSRNYLNVGGNSLLTIWHLASWCGPVDETVAPFSELTNSSVDMGGLSGRENSTQMAYESDAYHLQNAYVIPVGNSFEDEEQRNAVKQLIMQYGGLGMSYYADSSSTYDNPYYDCYYYDGPNSYSTNHAIMVVGWDDAFPKENFNEGHQPEGDGAWLMRNSWGEENGGKAQNGYFWLSYYDYGLRNSSSSTTKYAYVFDCEASDNYDHIYQYDGDAGHRRVGVESTGYKLRNYANVFQMQGKPGYQETLEAVGIGCSSVDADYTLQVYVDLEDEADPTGGTLAREQTGRIPFNGYHTISLDEPLALGYGQTYSVVFTFEQGAYVYASRSFEASNTWKFVAQNELHQSFARSKLTDAWIDLADNDTYDSCALRIKAYTKDTDDVSTYVPTPQPEPQPEPIPDPAPQPQPTPMPEPEVVPAVLTKLSLNKSSVNVVMGKTVELEATPSYDKENATDWVVYWKSSDSKVATVNACGEVQAKAAGKATITVYNGDVSASCDIYVLPGKQKAAQINVNKDKLTIRPVAQAGADGYVLYRSTEQNSGYKAYRKIEAEKKTSAFTVDAYRDGKAYYYKVRAYVEIDGKRKYGAFSDSYSVCPDQVEIAKVTAKKQAVTITWKKASKAAHYLVYRSLKKNGGYQQVKFLTGKKNVSFTDRGLKKGQTYYYKIRAGRTVNGRKIYGGYSDVLTVKVKKNGSITIEK